MTGVVAVGAPVSLEPSPMMVEDEDYSAEMDVDEANPESASNVMTTEDIVKDEKLEISPGADTTTTSETEEAEDEEETEHEAAEGDAAEGENDDDDDMEGAVHPNPPAKKKSILKTDSKRLEKQKSRSRRMLRWASRAMLRFTERSDSTRDEKWYKDEDYADFKKDCRRTIMYSRQHPSFLNREKQGEVGEDEGSSSHHMSVPDNTPDAAVAAEGEGGGSGALNRLPSIEQNICTRGLESMGVDKELAAQRRLRRDLAADTVITEQWEQYENGIDDPEALAQKYKRISIESQMAAHLKAKKEAEETARELERERLRKRGFMARTRRLVSRLSVPRGIGKTNSATNVERGPPPPPLEDSPRSQSEPQQGSQRPNVKASRGMSKRGMFGKSKSKSGKKQKKSGGFGSSMRKMFTTSSSKRSVQ